jgi:hypothetical protein
MWTWAGCAAGEVAAVVDLSPIKATRGNWANAGIPPGARSMPADEARPSILASVREVRRGLGEVFGFFWAAATAAIDFGFGRWPELQGSRRRKPSPPTEGMSVVEKTAPYPTQE